MRGPEQDGGTRRMAQREVRRRTVRQDDLLHEGRKVDVVLGEVLDVPLEAVAQRAPR